MAFAIVFSEQYLRKHPEAVAWTCIREVNGERIPCTVIFDLATKKGHDDLFQFQNENPDAQTTTVQNMSYESLPYSPENNHP